MFSIYLYSNLQTKKSRKSKFKKCFFKGNIKLIGKIENNKIKNINENILLKKDFGLLQVFMLMSLISA